MKIERSVVGRLLPAADAEMELEMQKCYWVIMSAKGEGRKTAWTGEALRLQCRSDKAAARPPSALEHGLPVGGALHRVEVVRPEFLSCAQ